MTKSPSGALAQARIQPSARSARGRAKDEPACSTSPSTRSIRQVPQPPCRDTTGRPLAWNLTMPLTVSAVIIGSGPPR